MSPQLEPPGGRSDWWGAEGASRGCCQEAASLRARLLYFLPHLPSSALCLMWLTRLPARGGGSAPAEVAGCLVASSSAVGALTPQPSRLWERSRLSPDPRERPLTHARPYRHGHVTLTQQRPTGALSPRRSDLLVFWIFFLQAHRQKSPSSHFQEIHRSKTTHNNNYINNDTFYFLGRLSRYSRLPYRKQLKIQNTGDKYTKKRDKTKTNSK